MAILHIEKTFIINVEKILNALMLILFKSGKRFKLT